VYILKLSGRCCPNKRNAGIPKNEKKAARRVIT
jgi:hypothetical protein